MQWSAELSYAMRLQSFHLSNVNAVELQLKPHQRPTIHVPSCDPRVDHSRLAGIHVTPIYTSAKNNTHT